MSIFEGVLLFLLVAALYYRHEDKEHIENLEYLQALTELQMDAIVTAVGIYGIEITTSGREVTVKVPQRYARGSREDVN